MNSRVFAFVAVFAVACVGSDIALRGGAYKANLDACNIEAKTLCESIACENIFRSISRPIREPRAVPKHCLSHDAGAGQ